MPPAPQNGAAKTKSWGEAGLGSNVRPWVETPENLSSDNTRPKNRSLRDVIWNHGLGPTDNPFPFRGSISPRVVKNVPLSNGSCIRIEVLTV
jgi:hypothetical protein